MPGSYGHFEPSFTARLVFPQDFPSSYGLGGWRGLMLTWFIMEGFFETYPRESLQFQQLVTPLDLLYEPEIDIRLKLRFQSQVPFSGMTTV